MQRRLNYFRYMGLRDLRSKRPATREFMFRSIHLNISLKEESSSRDSYLLKSIAALESISQQKVNLRHAKKALSAIQLQKGTVTGVSVTIRGFKARQFLERFASALFPSLGNLDTALQVSFDKQGGITFHSKSVFAFSEIEGEYQHFQQDTQTRVRSKQNRLPLSISLATDCCNRKEGELLLSTWHIPVAPKR